MAERGAGGQLLRDKRIYIAVILILAWIVGAVIALPFYENLSGGGDDDADNPEGRNYVDLASLVRDSTRIVIATYGFNVPGGLTETPVAEQQRPTVRRFILVEALRGGGEVGDELDVWGDPGPGPQGNLALEPGQDYLLFLLQRDFDGEAQWSPPGEPSAALVSDAGPLGFVVSDRYASDMRQLGWTSGEQRVPFEATLNEVRALAAGTPDPASPTP